LPGTTKLFDEDPYLSKFKAVVVAVNGVEVELDRTAFYPEKGGQAGDTGTIRGLRVMDAQVVDGKIIHYLEIEPGFGPGIEVSCELDWERRYRIMRLHSASHLMEHFLWQRLGEMERLGSFVDDVKDRADYVYDGRLPAEELKAVEDATNAFLAEGHEVRIDRKPDDPEIRVWRCGPVEMHCAGTHVRNTGEIGSVRLRRKNPGKGKERVETSLA